MRAVADRGVLGGQAERVVAHRPQHAVAAPPAQVGDDVADRVVQDVPHVQLARRVRQHLDDVRLARPRPRRARDSACGTRRASSQTRCQRCSISFGSYLSVISLSPGTKKPLAREAQGKLSRRRRVRLLCYGRSSVRVIAAQSSKWNRQPPPFVAAGPAGDRRIALTFDDGPAASTEAVLDLLVGRGRPGDVLHRRRLCGRARVDAAEGERRGTRARRPRLEPLQRHASAGARDAVA